MLNRSVRARRQAPPQDELLHRLTAPAGGGNLRRKKGKTERRRAGKRRIELTLRDNVFVSQNRTASCKRHLVSGTGEKANRLEGSGNGSTCEGAGRVG